MVTKAHRWRILPAGDEELDKLGDEDAVSIYAQILIVRQGAQNLRSLPHELERDIHGRHREFVGRGLEAQRSEHRRGRGEIPDVDSE